ncbi:MAG: tellurite resistance TerB family protein, partial [Desulfobacterales bacterium]
IQQGGMSGSTNRRLQNALGAGGPSSGGGLSDLLGGSGGLGSALSGLLGGGKSGGGIGGMLAGVLGDASRSIGGNKNLAIGGLGALAGSLLGGGGGSAKGAVGGGALAVLGAMAYSALKNAQQQPREVPLSVREPQNDEERHQLQNKAELILRAMINAAKADGHIDQAEIQRILGKLEGSGIDSEARDFVLAEMGNPMDTASLAAAARGNPQLGAELYAASLLAIEVDTPAERQYLENLARDLGLGRDVAASLEETLGIR